MTKNVGVTFDDSDATVKRAVAQGPTTVRAIAVTSDDALTRVVQLFHFDGKVERLLGSVQVLSDAGNDGTEVGVDLLNETDMPWVEVDDRGNNVVRLGDGESLRVGTTAAVSSGKFINVVAFGGDE